MPNTYTYSGLTGLSPAEVFFWVTVDETLKQLGVKDVEAVVFVLLGQPIIPTRGKFGGATPGTSPASVVMRKILNINIRPRLPTLTGAGLRTLRVSFTRNLGAFVGRTVPVVGWIILSYDVVQIIRHSVVTYNATVQLEDRIGL